MKRIGLIVLVVLVVVLLPSVAALAQGGETVPAPERITGEVFTLAHLVVTALAAAIAGGITVGGSVLLTVTLVVRFILKSPILITAMENLANSWPAPTREGLHDTGKLLQEIADGVPASTKTPS